MIKIFIAAVIIFAIFCIYDINKKRKKEENQNGGCPSGCVGCPHSSECASKNEK